VSAAGQSGVRLWRRAEPLVRGEDGVDRASRAFENLAEDVLRRIALARKAPPETPALRVETVPAPPPDGPDERLSFELEARFLELSAATLEELGLEWLVAWSEQYARLWDNPDGNVRNGCWPPPSAEDIRKRMVVVRHGEAERADDSTFSPPELELVLGSLAGNNLVESCADAWTTVRDGDLVRFAAPGIALDASVCKPGGRKGIAIEPSLAVELDPSAPLVAPPPVDLGLYSGSTVAIFLPGGDAGLVRLLLLTVREVGGEPAYSLDRTPAAPADFAALARLLAAEVRAESPPGEDADELRDDLFPLFPVEPDAPLEDADWKRLFAACGIDWPDGSFVHQMVRAHANFLTVRNTAPALRHVRRVLDALGNDQSRAARLLATPGSAQEEPHAESAEGAESPSAAARGGACPGGRHLLD
ncbi:MAG: hypothetical protein II839_06400, partial [Kiritimatiellae bacterium]|nr:hypothetical protein [Kiritimatiellia bacterium]